MEEYVKISLKKYDELKSQEKRINDYEREYFWNKRYTTSYNYIRGKSKVIAALKNEIDSKSIVIMDMKGEAYTKDREIEELKNRSLMQRILNK
jgi:hypothetical protein